jgi:hypothetical protein
MVEVIAKGLGANSKKPRETGRAFLTASHAGVVFPAPRVPTPPPPPGTFLQLFNCATTLDACQLHDCVVAAERGGGTQPQMGQILRYTERQLVSNHLTTDIIGADAGQWGIQSCCILQS